MKQIILLTILLCTAFLLNAQMSGKVSYTETIKMKFEMDLPDGIDLSGMIPESQSFNKELLFDQGKAIYRDSKTNENTDQEFTSDDGSLQIKFETTNEEDILFTDLKEKKSVHKRDLMGKAFLVEDIIKKTKWKLTGEKLKYLGYECQKAISTDGEKEIIAWFTPQIPVQHGPSSFNQLPGMVLMITTADQSMEIKATEIVLGSEFSEDIKMPTKGKKVSNEEFIEISEEKMKEMQEMMGGEGFIIKN